MASAKKSQTCPPLPERDRSKAAGQVHAAACLQEGADVFLPMGLVEIGRQEEAGLVLEHGVDAHDEIAAGVVLAGEVPANHVVGDGQEAAIRALRHI